jgi:hypothetical protein
MDGMVALVKVVACFDPSARIRPSLSLSAHLSSFVLDRLAWLREPRVRDLFNSSLGPKEDGSGLTGLPRCGRSRPYKRCSLQAPLL